MKAPLSIIALCAAIAIGAPLEAGANLVQNGDFSQITYSGSLPLTTVFGQFGTGSGSTLTLTDWTTTGYNFVYAPGTADSGTKNGAGTGQPNEAPGEYNTSAGYGDTYMWGPGNGVANGLTGPPSGNNFVAMDGAFQVVAIKQTITGLVVGQMYALTFEWGAAQQQNFTGATTENITATLGTQAFTTSTYNLATEGFSGWMAQTFDYTATSTSETLSFLATGTPNGEPPFSLLSDVSLLQVVPDFSNWMVFIGFGAVCIMFEAMRRRRRHATLTSAA